MQTPLVGKCEQFLNGAWVNLSARVPWLATPVSISRGLDDSGAPTAGSMTLTMANDDGALTPGATVELRRNHVVIPRATASWGISAGTGGATTNSVQADARFAGGVARQAIFDTAPTVVNTAYIWSAGSGPVMAVGETWVIAMRVAAVGYAGIYNLRVGGTNAPVCTYGVQQAIDHGDGTYTIWNTATCTSLGAGTGAFVVLATIGSAMTNGAQIRMGDAFAEKGATSFGGYFDGGYSPDGAMAPAWTGTANASASILTGVGAYLVRWRPIRVSVWANGAWRQRFYGYVNSEVLSWPTGDAGHCIVTVTAIDVIARMSTGSLQAISAEVVLATSPIAYWPLTDSGAPAANLSGVTWVDLLEEQIGEGGELSWGGGAKLPSDSSAGLMITAGDNEENGPYLRSGEFALPAAWSLAVNFTPSIAEPDGVLVEMGDDQLYVSVWWDSATRKCRVSLYSDSPPNFVETQLAESSAALPTGVPYRETLSFNGSHWRLGSASGPVAHPVGLPSWVRVSIGGSAHLGPTTALTGGVAHVAVWSGSLPALPTNLMPSATTISAWATQLAAWAGAPLTSVTTRGTNRTVVTPAIEGATATAVLGDLARGSLGRIAANTAGGMVVTAWDHTLTPVTAPAGEIDPDVEWGADPDGSPTMVTMTWPDGAKYRAAQSPERPAELPGVLPYTQGATVAEWTARVDTAIPRIPDAGYDLLTLPDATVQALCGLVVGDLITVPSLPGQLPSSSQTSIVDSIAETIGADQWMLKLATSADPRDRAFVVGDAVKGVVGAGYLAAPLGAGRGGADPWRAGETLDAAKLNARQYTGPMVQSGDLEVTPVANTDTSVTVTFPQTFPSLPRIVLTQNTSGPWTVAKGFSVASVSTTGFTLWFHRTNSDPYSFRWLAVV